MSGSILLFHCEVYVLFLLLLFIMKGSFYHILIFALILGFSLPVFGQKKSKRENFAENHTPFGGRKKERSNQKSSRVFSKRKGGLFKRKFSAGNADAFAANRISGRAGFLSSLFNPKRGTTTRNASLRKTRPGKVQDREQAFLFKRNRTNAKKRNSAIHSRQNKMRSTKRVRGNKVFATKKRK